MWTSDLTLCGLRVTAMLAAGLLLGALGWSVSSVQAVVAPTWGRRGRNRAAVRLQAASFTSVEPLLLVLAGMVATLPLGTLRQTVERLIRRAGDAAGLCAEEVLALSVVGLSAGAGMGAWFVGAMDLEPFWGVLLTVWCGALPTLSLRGIAAERAKALERSLPSAMDLCVLCMGAGTDFPSALGFASRELGLGHEICREELLIVLEQLALGRTRVEALEDMSARSGSETVQQFVAMVCQSETKGTPLVEALTIQSATLRQRRSVLAEEMAAKAGVRMMLPLMLMVGSVLLVIFGPFIVNGIGL